MTLQEAIEKAKNNKKDRVNDPDYVIIENNKEYPAVILNVNLQEDPKAVCVEFLIYNTADGKDKKYTFYLNGMGEVYYRQFCELLNVKSYKSLLGKLLSLHFEANGEYQNIKADAELTAEDIEEHIKKLKLNKKRKRLNKTVNKGNEKKIIHKKEYQEPFEDGIFEDDFLTDDE